MKKWFEIVNKADKAEIWIYEFIGEDFWTGDGVTAKGFQKELSGIKASQIDLHINSPGGEVFDGITIYNLLKQHAAKVTTYIDGLAASIASVIALAGDEVYMAENALFMIHRPWGIAAGDADDMRKMADSLDKVAGSILLAYTGKTEKEEADIAELMAAETWMTAAEALEYGFIDNITDKMDMAACAKFIPMMAKANFKNIPDELSGEIEAPTERELERALRGAGCSRSQAKEILAKGYGGYQHERDVHVEPVSDVRDAQSDAEQNLRDAEPQNDKAKEQPPNHGMRIRDRHTLPNYGGK